jgi:hypothetical protein
MDKPNNRSSRLLLLVAGICLVLWLLPTWQTKEVPEAKTVVKEVRLGLWFSPWLVWRDTRRTDGLGFNQSTDLTLLSWSWLFAVAAEVALWARRRQRHQPQKV